MPDPLPYGADTLVIPFTFVPDTRPRPEQAQRPPEIPPETPPPRRE
ncbi:MAG: hypothetical protein RQ966_02355 [Acetobacteraceae bacterium]|nr:hypothetical protein [Acetobacteraceae bacterium]